MRVYFTILKHYFINILYHFIIRPRSKTLFLLKYYFLTHYLLFLSIHSVSFLWAFQQPFVFLSPLAPVQHTTHNTHSWYTDQPIQTHHHTYTHKHKHQTSNKATHTNTNQQQSQAIHTNTNPFKNRATDQKPRPSHRSTPPIWNLDHRSKTGANPFKKNHHRSKSIQKTSSSKPPKQTHSKKIITGANPFKKIITGANPFKKMREMREHMESRDERANPFKKHHHRSHRSKPIQKKSSPEPSEQIHSKKWQRWESRDERANPFKKIITGATGANSFKNKHH